MNWKFQNFPKIEIFIAFSRVRTRIGSLGMRISYFMIIHYGGFSVLGVKMGELPNCVFGNLGKRRSIDGMEQSNPLV